jgi:hypothetical protein
VAPRNSWADQACELEFGATEGLQAAGGLMGSWPGTVLELSTKIPPDAASVIYSELQQFVKMKHLFTSPVQALKTTVALETITRAASRP